MTLRVPKRAGFASAEYELVVITALLLHDVGKTASYTDEGYCAGRALTMGYELLGVELICKPLGALSAAQADLGNALTALLLSRTCFACSPLSPRGHPAGDPQDRRLERHAECEAAMRP